MPQLIALLLPAILHLIENASPAEGEELVRRLNAAVDRRKAAVSRNESLDAPRDAEPPTL